MLSDFCNICYESKPTESFATIPICSHTFCTSCLLQYLHYISASKEYYNLKCPFSQCTTKDIDPIVKSLLTDSEYKKFNQEKYSAILSLDPNIRWCPTPDCKGYSEVSEKLQLICNTCGADFCKDCSQLWDINHKCSKTKDLHEYLKNLGARACPGCKNIVEKKSGCTSMTCRCGTLFCMTCGEMINDKHDGIRCLLGLERPSVMIIVGLLLSLAVFPFHFGFYMLRIRVFDIKDETGMSVYNWKNVIGYIFLFVISPIVLVFIVIILPMCLIWSKDSGVDIRLPHAKWFWPIKPLIWILCYIAFFVSILIGYLIFNLYLTIRGVIVLVRRIFKR